MRTKIIQTLHFGRIFIGCIFFLGFLAAINAQSVSNDPTFNSTDAGFGFGDGANLGIYSSAKQNDGKIIIGGAFSTYNGTARYRIARLNEDGTLDTSFNPGTGANGDVNSIVIQPDHKIVIGGEFTVFNGLERNRVARLNADGSLDMTFNPGSGANDNIYSLSLQNDGKILVGGSFTAFNGMVKNYLARLNSDGTLENSFNPTGGPDSGVYSISVQNDGKILIGGAFAKYEGTARNKLARLNASGNLDGTFNPGSGVNGEIYTMALQNDGKVIIGGGFTVFNGMSRNNIARVNSNGTLDASFNVGSGANNIIYNLTIQNDGKILVGGSFFNFNGVNKKYFIRLNNTGSLDPTFNADKVTGSIYTSLQQSDEKIIACGVFSVLSGALVNNLIRVNLNGTIDESFNKGTGANGNVSVVKMQNDGKIIIAGRFTTYFGLPKYHIARLFSDGALDVSFNADNLNDPFNIINSVALQNDGKMIVAGALYYNSNGVAINIARLTGNGTLDATFNSGTTDDTNGDVTAIAIQNDGKIMIGGEFTAYAGINRKNIARLNSNGTLDVTFNPGLGANARISDIIIQNDGKIIICGDFTSYNGVEKNHIVRLNTDGTLDLTFNPGSAANGNIRRMALQSNGKIIIGGSFTSFNGAGRNRIARINNDGTIDESFNPGTGANFNVTDIVIQTDGKIIIGGSFTAINGTGRNRIARMNIDGTLDMSFNPGSGANDNVTSLALQNDGKVVAVGLFTSFNGIGRNRITRLKVCNPTNSTLDESACNNYTAPDNKVYNNSGIYTAVIPNAAGCDSIITINLTIKKSTASSVNETSCDSYTAPDGVVYGESGNYTAVIPNSAGCDSTITIHLTIRKSTASSIIAEACESYTAPDGMVYYSSGLYTSVIQNTAGCDSTISINLIIQNVDVSLTVNDPVISANAANATYQWVDCDNNFMPVAGANNQSFTASRNGNYAVIITQGMCTDTSECVQIISSGTSNLSLKEIIHIYPNPFSQEFTIEIEGVKESRSYDIINNMGQVIIQGNMINLVKIDAADFSSGIYLVRIGDKKSFQLKKLIKY